jgi:hypothetical protein
VAFVAVWYQAALDIRDIRRCSGGEAGSSGATLQEAIEQSANAAVAEDLAELRVPFNRRLRAGAASKVGLEDCPEEMSVASRGQRDTTFLVDVQKVAQKGYPKRCEVLVVDEGGIGDDFEGQACHDVVRPADNELRD